jgi:hypothetical protein
MKKLLIAFLLSIWHPLYAHATLITNGSFETSSVDPTLNVAPGATDITGWTVTRDYIGYADSASSDPSLVWQAFDGTRSLDLDGTPRVGGIAQTFATQVG